jgi:hypothetical protein
LLKSVFSYFIIEKLCLSFFTITEYNNASITKYFQDFSNFSLFAISGFVLLSILILIHYGIHKLRNNPKWNLIQSLFLICFTLSESVVVGYLQANTESTTVLMFINVISAMVVSIGMFVSSGRSDEITNTSIQD